MIKVINIENAAKEDILTRDIKLESGVEAIVADIIKNVRENGDKALKGLEVQPVKAEDSNIYKYVYGVFGTKGEAAARLSEVRKKFPEAFVVKVSGTTVTRAK